MYFWSYSDGWNSAWSAWECASPLNLSSTELMNNWWIELMELTELMKKGSCDWFETGNERWMERGTWDEEVLGYKVWLKWREFEITWSWDNEAVIIMEGNNSQQSWSSTNSISQSPFLNSSPSLYFCVLFSVLFSTSDSGHEGSSQVPLHLPLLPPLAPPPPTPTQAAPPPIHPVPCPYMDRVRRGSKQPRLPLVYHSSTSSARWHPLAGPSFASRCSSQEVVRCHKGHLTAMHCDCFLSFTKQVKRPLWTEGDAGARGHCGHAGLGVCTQTVWTRQWQSIRNRKNRKGWQLQYPNNCNCNCRRNNNRRSPSPKKTLSLIFQQSYPLHLFPTFPIRVVHNT